MELEEVNSKLQDTVYLLQQQVSDLQRRLDGRQTGDGGSLHGDSASSESQQIPEADVEGDGQLSHSELEGTSKLEQEQQLQQQSLIEQKASMAEALTGS
jgi:hypothetical protein